MKNILKRGDRGSLFELGRFNLRFMKRNFPAVVSTMSFIGIATLFAASPCRAQAFATLANFIGSNGTAPQSNGSAFVQGADGNFYGTTTSFAGNVFKLTPSGVLT